MNIHQLSAVYRPEADRILLRINTSGGEEILCWLTRRLMSPLWPVLGRLHRDLTVRTDPSAAALHTADDSTKKILTDFRKDEYLRKADLATPYKNTATAHPLGTEPLLVTGVDAQPLSDGRLRLKFNEQAGEGNKPRGFQVEMDRELIQGLMHLLESALQRSGWTQPFEDAGAPREAKSEPASPADRPRYLN